MALLIHSEFYTSLIVTKALISLLTVYNVGLWNKIFNGTFTFITGLRIPVP